MPDEHDAFLVLEATVLGPDARIILLLDHPQLATARAAHPGLPVYVHQEISAMVQARPSTQVLRVLNAAKRLFNGWVVETPLGPVR